uniref:Hsp90 chaperone protein kinase-targeting subunit n=1 Tax=Globodera rostochiensis TaxID=31243 RepID=A0A914HV96_GLORO
MPIDYSTWNNIEVSDDEDDTHPNIDTPSLFRWRHQARVERQEEIEQAKKEVNSEKKNVITKLQEIEEKLKNTGLEEKERIKLELELDTIHKQEDEFRRKEKELEEKERQRPWNVDTIGREVWSKSVINKPKEGKEQQKKSTTNKESEEEEHNRTIKYFKDNEALLNQLCTLDGFDKLEKHLLEHPHLASEYATNFLTIEALNHAIDEEEIKMSRVAENCIMIQYELELAKSLNALATNTNMIRNFFKKFRAADEMYMKLFSDEVDAFKDRLRKRARDKREAMINEVQAEEKEKRVAESPGGLDPQEVFDTLPEEMQEAFETQSTEKMLAVAEHMDPEVFQHHLQRCIDSGLWIPNAKEHEEQQKEKNKE